MRIVFSLVLLAVVTATGPATGLSAQDDSVTVVAGPQYRKGAIHRWLFGNRYRALWAKEVRVPVLNLATHGGGLKPLKKGGGQQTKSLRFVGGDGRQYAFRSIDKDPSVVLPEGLRETFAARIFQDQISAGHPLGALVVPPILDAAGVLHATPVLVMMPDDPGLGEYRGEFGNVLGLLEERPRDADEEGMSFAGAKEIVGTADLIKRLDDHPDIRVDSREFLLARLTDVFLGDWDRHRDQWRWALLGGGSADRWVAIPRDRDQAFVRFDGLLLALVRPQIPQLVNFGPKYSPTVGATWNGRDLDRRFLTDLERPAWDSVANVLRARMTDRVIESGIARLPAEYQAIDGARLRTALIARRNTIPAMAEKFYRHLAGQVDIYGSDHADVVEVTRPDPSTVAVAVRRRGGQVPYYARRFDKEDTRDIRIYLQGGADSAMAVGDGGPITVRLIGGGGDDWLGHTGTGATKFYDSRGANVAVGGEINTRPYRAIDDTTKPTALPHRDWGNRKFTVGLASLGPDAGLIVGFGGTVTNWGFRKKPYSSRFQYSAGFATGAATGRLVIDGRIQRENSRSYFAFRGLGSGIEVLRWYGFGNERTVDSTKPLSFNRATQHQLDLAPSIGWAVGEKTLIEFGPRFKYSATELDDGQNAARFIASDRPYGTGTFAQLGVGASFRLDTRDSPIAARRGSVVEFGGAAYPAAFDVERSFGEVHGRVATYLTANVVGPTTLALQAGGKKLFGARGFIPFHEAAFLGSSGTLRGFRSNRFAGEGSLYGSAELRVQLTNAFILVPGHQGLVGFFDGGRVYLRGETSSQWQTTFGGGVWFSFLRPANVISVVFGHSDEGNKIYARVGFGF